MINQLTKTVEFRVKLYPRDFYKVKKFYQEDLSYPIIESWNGDDDNGVMFNTGSATIEIMTPREDFIPPIRGMGLALKVEDVWELWEKLKDHPNIVRSLSTRPSPWGDISFRIKDPEGVIITFFTPNSQKPLKRT